MLRTKLKTLTFLLMGALLSTFMQAQQSTTLHQQKVDAIKNEVLQTVSGKEKAV